MLESKESQTSGKEPASNSFLITAPAISMPKGGGAMQGMGEKFSANPVTGTGSLSVPIATSPGRGGFGPQLTLSYDSGAGNGLFGLGWSLSLPSIARKTDRGIPRYRDSEESDAFILAGVEDLVPLVDAAGQLSPPQEYTVYGTQYLVREYRPRVEGLFALIERWTEKAAPANMFWRVISRDNVTTWYGKSNDSRIRDAEHPAHIFQWFVSETHDDKGNVALYRYAHEDAANVVVGSVEEANRTPAQRTANCYPDRIVYGNLKPYLPALDSAGGPWPGPNDVPGQDWMFEVVFDYSRPGSNDASTAAPTDTSTWLVRADPFSSHRAGFEVRTYRLCRRVLMFHHFDELGISDCLVRSTDFEYAHPIDANDPGQSGYTVLQSVTHRAYENPSAAALYDTRQLPPVQFTYSEPKVSSTVQTIAPDQLENLPVGTQGSGYQWIDLDGEGLSGVLSEQAGAWHYKPNLGDGRFGPSRVVARQPAMAFAAGSRHQLMDLAGHGEINVVDFSGPTPGFHERDGVEGWKRHVPFASLPTIDWSDPNLRFLDLTGDGHADALITEQEVFTWYPSLDERGFGPSERSYQPHEEDSGPHLVFADGTQTIFLADLCGDGLTDLVRVRNSEVCYWPNLGYGRFGRKVTLKNSPRFDHEDLYDPRRIRLADIDGSGPVDLIYLGRQGAQLYFNRSGNSLSHARLVDLPVATENLAAVQVADLLGNGTACLVWNSHLPADARTPVRYIDLMGGANEPATAQRTHEKPHLLIRTDNNLGRATEIEYQPSTRFYLQDKIAGTPWVTRLPFPVHCVSKVTVRDTWRNTAFSSTYSYHHGYFDGSEREFRGFGRVEQIDVEIYDQSADNNIGSPFVTQDHRLYQPPIKMITWYHTGAALDRRRILSQFAQEYFPARYPFLAGFQEQALPEPELPADLSADEWREALRACKGLVLRQEVYELDVEDLAAPIPQQTPVRMYSAATHNCHIQRLQSRGENRHAVFLVTESEALSYQYELALPKGATALTPDPRIAHTLNLRHDDYGNPQQSVVIGYPRLGSTLPQGLPADTQRDSLMRTVQSELHIAYRETRYAKDVVLPEPAPGSISAIRHHRLRMPCEAKTYAITGLTRPPLGGYFAMADLRRHALCEDNVYPPIVPAGQTAIAMTPLPYHQQPLSATPHRRIVEHTRTLFFDDASDTSPPAAPLPFGQQGPRGLTYEGYKLALTTGLLDAVFKHTVAPGTVDDKLAWTAQPGITARDVLDAPTAQNPQHLKSGYMLGGGIDASLTGQYWVRSGIAGFASDAHRHFFLPEQYMDPFGNRTELRYDSRDLFIQSSTDALGNTTGIGMDAITGQPRFDYRVLAPIEMVDSNGNHAEVRFDILGRVVASAIKGKFQNNQWDGDHLDNYASALVNPPTAAVVSFCTSATFNAGQARIWLANASARFIYHFGDEGGAWAQRPAGACTIAREIHASQPGGAASPLQVSLECSDGSGQVLMKKVQAEAESVGGPPRWIINGLTVLNNKGKPVKQYEPAFSDRFGCEMPQANGVTAIVYYDAAGRVMRTEMPDGTLSRVEFSPWHVKTFDANDTVLESRWYSERNPVPHAQPLPRDPLTQELTVTPDQRAAWLAAQHANTPALTILDSLGRDVIAIAHNRTLESSGVWQDESSLTYTKLDAEGKPLWIRDARGNLVMQYILPAKAHNHPSDAMPATAAPCYDIAGNLLFQHSMDAGGRWVLMDAAGKPMLAWDYNEFQNDQGVTPQNRLFRTEYDALYRPTKQWLKINGAAPALIEAFEYRDTLGLGVAELAAAQGHNLIGQAVKHWDPSGLATVEQMDLSGQPNHITRSLTKPDAGSVSTGALNWNIPNPGNLLDAETFHQLTEYDALGRMTRLYHWHRLAVPRIAIYEPTYNQRGALLREDLVTHATGYDSSTGTRTTAIQEIRYTAKGQKEYLKLGNGTETAYTYDAKSFRLTALRTVSPNSSRGVQDVHYTYDPVGNITHIQDDAQDTIWFANAQVEPSSDYVYDALYRLIEATGRENIAAAGAPPHAERPWVARAVPSPDATRNYVQRYRYDRVGNVDAMQHVADRLPGQPDGSWTRYYDMAGESNRLQRTWYGDPDWNGSGASERTEYRHDTHGSMLNLASTAPGLDLRWDWHDMICAIDLIGGGAVRYNYGIDKQRTRKRITRNGGVVEDRIYLGGYELYRRYKSGIANPVEEIESLHLFEGEQRVLLVDDVLDTDSIRPDLLSVKQQTLYRYQYGNHLGTVGLELDHAARIISYEEFHPYGTSAYRLMNSAVEAPPNRYRYTGMERDEESGLGYHQTRYYAPWLGRWGSSDPIGQRGGLNLYSYSSSSPIVRIDTRGKQDEKVTANEHHRVCNACHSAPSAAEKMQMYIRDFETMAQPQISDEKKSEVLANINKFENEELPELIKKETKKEVEWDERIDEPKHVERVRLLVNILLIKAELVFGEKVSAQDKLDAVLSRLTDIRQQRKDNVPKIADASRSILLRDAQYYLWGRAGPGTLGTPGRDALAGLGAEGMKRVHDYKKSIARRLGSDFGTDGRSSDNGGYAWFRLGLSHEKTLRSEEINLAVPPRLLSATPSLTADELEKVSTVNIGKPELENLKWFFRKTPTLESIISGAK